MDVEDALSTTGHSVHTANSCAKALEILDAMHVHAALVDIVLRDRDCDDLVAQLRKRAIPFAYYTGLSGQQVMERWPAKVINKPAAANQIVSDVNGLLHCTPR